MGIQAREESTVVMPGALILVAILFIFPIIFGLSTALLAGLLGHLLWKDSEIRSEGSELLETNI